VEVTASAASWWDHEERIEVVVDRRRIRVPDGFEAETLRRVLDVLEGRE